MADVTSQVSASLKALTREFDIIAHNLANVSTAGYKRRCSSFSSMLEDQQNAAASALDFSQGNLVETRRTLDVALYGKGFFVIETPDGPLYTRHGVFRANQNGQIVDSEGRSVAGAFGPLTIPTGIDVSRVTISQTGQIHADGASIGQFRIVDFAGKEDQLEAVGFSCYRAPQDVPARDVEDVVVKQGYQEASNVEIIDELVSMIMVSRMYESNMKLVNVKKDTTNSVIGVAMG
ncbi:MAG TPA: flagellar hook basal-body protein [Sedimentisphaerales bacterium]|nr:flagellar hook basal-body protein [Sedimentisphaerales bacterium]HRS10865.1 flagellar hook basal-body protein [Sedimentisphaerales bacterium]HRV47570.1 flagellar hook basal-body protein [Sedimentisphaerales bacterium]